MEDRVQERFLFFRRIGNAARAGRFRARSSKRAGGLIPRIALDQCRVPERYRTGVPFRIPEREVDRAAWPFHFFIEILESAGCEPVEETGQGFDS